MEIKWAIVNMERDTATGFVRVAHWICTGVDGEFTGSVYASCGFEGELSVPYEQLTESTVLGWVWESVDKEATEAAVAAQINAQKNPVQASGLPW
jgi:hypothetical protein